MDLEEIVERLTTDNEISQETILDYSKCVSNLIKQNRLKIVELVQKLNNVLTSSDHNLRLRGVQILSHVITSIQTQDFSEKEIEVLNEFLSLRILDHRSMETHALKCLSYFIDCQNKSTKYNQDLLEFLKTKANVHKMGIQSRSIVYEIVRKMVKQRSSVDSDFIYSLIHMVEGENNPQNLLICFNLMTYVLKTFQELEPYVDDIFEWLSSYYPIDYTPNSDDGIKIKRQDLVEALQECFFASPLNSENFQTLMLEKLESNVTSCKVESLKCLTKCYGIYPLDCIKKYASSLWTSLRMICLKKLDTVDCDILESSYEALSALATRLSEDREAYMTFVMDSYEELAIAFRKPEMDLFEPATRLIVNAALPMIDGLNYVIDKILPISLNAFKSGEMRPLSGLCYLFDKMLSKHNSIQIKPDNIIILSEMTNLLSTSIGSDIVSFRLINTFIRGKVKFDDKTLINLRDKLIDEIDESQYDIEETLALMNIIYDQSGIISEGESKISSLDTLLEWIHKFVPGQQKIKFSIYLRRVVLTLDTCGTEILVASNTKLDTFLVKLRELGPSFDQSSKIIENIGILHGIIFNKSPNDMTASLLMKFFNSEFCQKMIPTKPEFVHKSTQIYLPVLKWVLKSLVLRNHQLVVPLVNLLLNFISSENVDLESAVVVNQIFTFVLSEDLRVSYKQKDSYQVFVLHKQKFYSQVRKEIKIRAASDIVKTKKYVMICLLALLTTQMTPAAYRNDFNWILRELIIVLQESSVQIKESVDKPLDKLISVIYRCLSNFITNMTTSDIEGYLGTLIELSLSHACEAKSLNIRKISLECLSKLASCIDEKQLLPNRSIVVDKLRICLADKKRIVRQEAANARLRWFLVGQPVGS